MAMKYHDNHENNSQSGDELGSNVVTTVERNYDAEISSSLSSIPKSEVVETHIQPFNLNQELLNQANAYHLAQQYKFNTDLYFHHQKQTWKNLEDFYKTVERFNEDECKSLVFAHNMYTGNTTVNMNLDKGAFKPILKSMFKTQHYPIQYFHELMQFKIDNQLPDSSLNWIKDDLRNALHIAYVVQGSFYDKTMVGGTELVSHISNYLKYEVTHFNCSPLTLPYYANLVDINSHPHPLTRSIEIVKSNYFRNRTDREIKWLKGDDSEQVEWAYNYLSSEKRDHLILQNVFIPVSLEDKYNLILASLDILSNVDYTYECFTKNINTSDPNFDFETIPVISYRDKVIENMKDAWNKFSASNKNEDLSQIKIYKKDQDLLDSIKKAEGTTSASKVVGQLIKDEHDRIFNKK
ncbi:hypothetical protein [Psychrobacter sp. JCM 18900]|uniref:hypothetical protein n=1 Tax=Psychrobacter sp. JCM 18900 TaxID=1298608 RepID=UPI00191B5693|nr:hypothetical protein [Psychrobacter sp. JCM 18900]